MHGVAQYANDLGREHRLQNLDGFLHIALIGERHVATCNIFPCALAQCLDVGKERLRILVHCLLLNGHARPVFIHRQRMSGRRTLRASSRPATSGPSFGGLASNDGVTPCSRSAREQTGPIDAMTRRFSWPASSEARPVVAATVWRLCI